MMLLLAALFAVAVENLTRKRAPPQAGRRIGTGDLRHGRHRCAGAGLHHGARPRLAHHRTRAVGAPGVAYVGTRAAAARAALARGRARRWSSLHALAMKPRIVGADVGATPIFSAGLLYGYGVPALSFWVAGYLLRKRDDDVPARVVDSAAILFSVLLIVLEIRHYITNGNIYNVSSSMTEVALQVRAGLAPPPSTSNTSAAAGALAHLVHNIGALIRLPRSRSRRHRVRSC